MTLRSFGPLPKVCIAAWCALVGACRPPTAEVAPQSPGGTASFPVARAVAEARQWLSRPRSETPIPAFAPALETKLLIFDRPCPQRIWIARLDASTPGVGFVLTEPHSSHGEDGTDYETLCENTLEFAKRHRAQLAINTSAFGPFRASAGQPMDVVGLAAREGTVYSPPVKDYGAMFIARDGRVSLKAPPFDTKEAWDVIPGFGMLVDDGRVVVDPALCETSFGGANPRTAVGVDREGRTLWVVVADGRQPQFSVGLTLPELAAVFLQLGAWDALNLDGGGSTTLVMQDADGLHHVLNSPIHGGVPGRLRQVANNLGLLLPGRGPSSDDLTTLPVAAEQAP